MQSLSNTHYLVFLLHFFSPSLSLPLSLSSICVLIALSACAHSFILFAFTCALRALSHTHTHILRLHTGCRYLLLLFCLCLNSQLSSSRLVMFSFRSVCELSFSTLHALRLSAKNRLALRNRKRERERERRKDTSKRKETKEKRRKIDSKYCYSTVSGMPLLHIYYLKWYVCLPASACQCLPLHVIM